MLPLQLRSNLSASAGHSAAEEQSSGAAVRFFLRAFFKKGCYKRAGKHVFVVASFCWDSYCTFWSCSVEIKRGGQWILQGFIVWSGLACG